MTDTGFATNRLIMVPAADSDQPEAPRWFLPVVTCDACTQFVSDGVTAHVYTAQLADATVRPQMHPTLPIVVHDRCLSAFLDARPGKWSRMWTAAEFLRQLTRFATIDERKRAQATGSEEPDAPVEIPPAKAAGRPGFAA